MAELTGMRFCNKCYALFFDGGGNKGLCPADGHEHVAAGYKFVVEYGLPDSPTMQGAWQQCGKCQVVFFDGYPDKGRCDAGGAHRANRKRPFVLPHDRPGDAHHQTAWEYCEKCKAMFYDGYEDKGHCAAGGGHHRNANAYRFALYHDPSVGFGDDNVGIPA
jgi:hypothetical protein